MHALTAAGHHKGKKCANGINTSDGSSVPQVSSSQASSANFGEGFNCITQLDRMVNHLLEVMDCALHLLGSGVPAPIRQKAVKTASALLLLPTPNPVQTQARYVLATLYGTRATYHSYKDGVLLLHSHLLI